MSEYIDYTSDPSQNSNRYKISVTDTCGNISDLSPYHKTIRLGIAQGGSASSMLLVFDAYEDEGGGFIPLWNYIYRGTSASTMELYDSVTANVLTYTDEPAPIKHREVHILILSQILRTIVCWLV